MNNNKLTLVYVEDDNILREVVMDELGIYFDAHIYSNPLDAKKYIEDHHEIVDILLTDYVMPELNGYELIKSAKNQNSNIKAILLTGYCKDLNAVMDKSVCDLILEKNVLSSIDELNDRIKKIF
ncbi:MAG: hypothetical protein A2Y40_00480 [Candidatus Margulisbacteria bacterium GWF2_35_9]|nr:MAG: hypothetical protein A2Y40_00480 [Candidatus Margulisbacteria bacterium GWF2_35_9]